MSWVEFFRSMSTILGSLLLVVVGVFTAWMLTRHK